MNKITKTKLNVRENRSENKIFLRAALSSIGCVFISAAGWVNAGAWVPEQGQGYGKVGIQQYEADSFFGGNDEFKEFVGTNISYYGEFGLGGNTAVYGTLLYQNIEQTSSAGDTTHSSGLSDVEIGLRHQWFADPFVFSTSILAKLPYLYDEDEDLPRGNGQNDYEIRALFGKSLYPYGYIGIEAAYRYRTGSPSDEYRYLLEYGISANENLYFRTKLDGVYSAVNADSVDVGDAESSNLLLGPAYDLGKLELTVGWNFGPERERTLGRWGVELTYITDLYGDNTLEGDAVQLGFTRVF